MPTPTTLPEPDEMMRAFMGRDAAYDGVFYTGVRTTGIFCRVVCTARKPLPKNVQFFATARDALFSGFRPCKRCRPMEHPGQVPEWVQGVLQAVEAEPERRWRDQDVRELGVDPSRLRRWFKTNHGITFHAYARARRLGRALSAIRKGDAVTGAAFDHGYDSVSGFSDAVHKLLGTSPGAVDGEPLLATLFESPLGPLLAVTNADAVCLLEFADRRMLETQIQVLRKRLDAPVIPGRNAVTDQLETELGAYFSGERRQFDVPLRIEGTEFQETVWRALIEVPYGRTASYGDLARTIGRPTAVRAVANANGDNRLAILIPCHRIVGSDGSLTGYGGGLWRKRRLLDHETGLFKLGG